MERNIFFEEGYPGTLGEGSHARVPEDDFFAIAVVVTIDCFWGGGEACCDDRNKC